MPLLRGDRFVSDDWRALADDEPLPGSEAVIVPLQRLLAEAETYSGRLGVRLEPGERVEQIEPWLPKLGLVALAFPSFADGRAFSTARILRERYGFAGEVRAIGDVQIDRYQFMRQCGFDSFEVCPERLGDRWVHVEVEMGLTYQHDYAEQRGAEAVWLARQARPAMAAE